MQVQYELSDSSEEAELTKLRELLAERNSTRRDPTGFRRVLLLATKSPGLIAVHSGDGHVLWHRWVPEHAQHVCREPLRLLHWQVPHSADGHPQVRAGGGGGYEGGVYVAGMGDSFSGKWRYFRRGWGVCDGNGYNFGENWRYFRREWVILQAGTGNFLIGNGRCCWWEWGIF